MRCNARCDFCDYWKTPASEKTTELKSFADAARFFDPLMVCFTGGEPLLRRDLEDLVSAVSGAVRLKYITLITHGAMLTVERARSLWHAGINQFSISLDFLDERHDHARGIPGLAARILDVVPRLRAVGIDNVRFNTVIKDENVEHVMDIVRTAATLGIGVGFSTYTDMKNGNAAHFPRGDRLASVDRLVEELLAFKRRHRGVITSSDWYLRQIPRYFRGELRDLCASGLRTIHIDPISGDCRRLQHLHGHEERERRSFSAWRPPRERRSTGRGAPCVQAPTPRCDHELGLVSASDSPILSRRAPGLVRLGIADDSHRSDLWGLSSASAPTRT